MDPKRKAELLAQLVHMLEDERDVAAGDIAGADDLWLQFRALVNTRPAWPVASEFLKLQDELLQGVIAESGVHGLTDTALSPLDPRLRLWRGDITTLAADAVVNAANSQLLGCWAPLHYCIDNAIHTFAGVQLRIECAHIMAEQGHDEPTGRAKTTPAYNLPCKRVIHTVGPIANGHPTALHREQLASCYTSCLDTASSEGLSSIAFCCVSTGVFGFPRAEAAEIAVCTVRNWLDKHNSEITVVFNVFSESDEQIYRQHLHIRESNPLTCGIRG